MKSTNPGKIKILHLEDQPSDAEQVAYILKKAHLAFEVMLVTTRLQYSQALEEFKPEVIICDHNLPSFNSIEALEMLKRLNLKIPFVLVTGTVSEEFAVEAMRAGVDDYILKDRMQRLPVAIQSVLNKYKLERERAKRETLLRNIDANSLDMICSISEEGHFLHVSAASEKILGYAPEELVGKIFYDFVYREDLQKTSDTANQLFEGRLITNFQNRYMRKDGSLVTLSWSACWDEHDRVMYGVARDVTEKNRAEEKMRDAERVIATERKRLADLFMNAPVSMCITSGRNHVFELANPIYLKLAGKEDIVGKPGFEVFPGLKEQGLVTLLDRIYESGKPFKANEMEFKIDREGNGQLTSIYQNVLHQPYLDVDGNVAGLFYFGIDVTEQVVTRQKIEEAEKRYRQIVETAQEGIWVVDEHDRTTFVNSKMCEMFEYKREEMIGKPIHAFMDDKGRKIIAPVMQDKRNGKSSRGQFKYISKTGKEIWTITSANPLFHDDGTYKGALAMVTDITAQKKIEEENKKLSDVASLTVNAVIVTDTDGRITWVNKGFERITEYTLAEVAGKKPGHILQGPETDQATIRYMAECIKKGEGFRVEILNYSKSGRAYWLDIEVRPLHDTKNKHTGFMAIEQDITEKKTIELERLAMIDMLQNKNKDLQQFSYIVSHNLRAPIAKIIGLVSVMESESEENKFMLQKLTEEAEQLDNVVKDINTIVSARKSPKEKLELVSLEDQLNLITLVLEDTIDSHITILSDFKEAPALWTIKSYLYSILYNLISNSIKYRKPEVPAYIQIKSFQDEKFIGISVEDNGEGIDLVKNGSKVFGLYKRFHTGSVSGKGIGLNLVKTHAESLGGRVEIESEPTVGTIFRVYIPKYYEKTE